MGKITDREISKIVKKVISENKKENMEGLDDVWAGLKGVWRGQGYSYSKNMSKLQDIVEDLKIAENYHNKIKMKCDKIIDDVANSKMPQNSSDQILDITNRILQTIDVYNTDMEKIYSEIRSVLK